MEIIRTIKELQQRLSHSRAEGKSIGLVPTMGALHEGHLSLVREARKGNDTVVVSVFVNPTQFNNPDDLATYPRKEEQDAALLREAGVDFMFAPSVDEMYPSPDEKAPQYDLGRVAEVLEGKFRPGHFQGVAQVVDKLFTIVNPDRAYFGEKDFQQIAVIRRMVQTCGHKLEIVPCEIVRDDEGLALSSRNALLSPEEKKVATNINKIIRQGGRFVADMPLPEFIGVVRDQLSALPGCRLEYFHVVDSATLENVENWDDAPELSGVVAIYCGKVRLIDHVDYQRQGKEVIC